MCYIIAQCLGRRPRLRPRVTSLRGMGGPCRFSWGQDKVIWVQYLTERPGRKEPAVSGDWTHWRHGGRHQGTNCCAGFWFVLGSRIASWLPSFSVEVMHTTNILGITQASNSQLNAMVRAPDCCWELVRGQEGLRALGHMAVQCVWPCEFLSCLGGQQRFQGPPLSFRFPLSLLSLCLFPFSPSLYRMLNPGPCVFLANVLPLSFILGAFQELWFLVGEAACRHSKLICWCD